MLGQSLKTALKRMSYRTVGETTALLRGPEENGGRRTLRVLMYHKVNDVPENPSAVPVATFARQMELLGRLGYPVVDLDAVLAHYGPERRPLPERATLITFDDGYRDVLVHAAPVLERHGYPAVLFVPIAYVDGRMPLPHDRLMLARRGVPNPPIDWDEAQELERRGVRIESHGISHRPLSELALEDSLREIALSKLALEERLGREVAAFAYIKGSQRDFLPVHASLLQQAGYRLAFTAITGANGPESDPFRLRRYNVEPYGDRELELLLTGACDLLMVKDTVAGAYARRTMNRVLGTATEP